MSTQRMRMLIVVSLGLVTLMLCTPALWAGPPAQEVILESDSTWDFDDANPWTGPAIIWIDGVRYQGEIFYHGEGKMNFNGWHGTEYHDYFFPDLGWLYLSGTAKTSFAFVTPEHRWHRYSSHVKIVGGTGAFAEAHGVFQLVGYTNWLLPPYYLPPEAFAFTGGKGMIVGIEVD
jgi:hypothetical protein